jgi:hypothetical protein
MAIPDPYPVTNHFSSMESENRRRPHHGGCDQHGERRASPPKDRIVAHPRCEKRREGDDEKGQKTELLHAEVSHRGLACVSHASIMIPMSLASYLFGPLDESIPPVVCSTLWRCSSVVVGCTSLPVWPTRWPRVDSTTLSWNSV